MLDGKLAEGQAALSKALDATPGDDQARFGLGVIQFFRAVEARMQGLHRHGYRTDGAGTFLGISNLPIPPKSKPATLDYAGFRAMLQSWIDDLKAAEATLARIRDPAVKLPLRVGLARFDFDGDGATGDEETFWKVYGRFNRVVAKDPDAASRFVVAFDRADVDWLRGYCHLLMATSEVILAYDGREVFDHTGHLFFAGATTRFPFLRSRRAFGMQEGSNGELADLIALIHLLRMPVVEPARLGAALGHLESMTSLSRSMWASVLAEGDDDREWIPNPKQKTVVPGGEVSDAMVRGWLEFLDEFDAILAGRALVPFWRGDEALGVNVRRVFTEPGPLELVLWVQGTAAVPYLERGRITDPALYERLGRVFRGEFLGFAIWFN